VIPRLERIHLIPKLQTKINKQTNLENLPPNRVRKNPQKKKSESKSNLVSSTKNTSSKSEEISRKEETPLSRKEETPLTGNKRKRESLVASTETPPIKRQKKVSKKSRDTKQAKTKSTEISKTAPQKSLLKNKGNATTGVETEKQNTEKGETKSGKSEKGSRSGEKSGKSVTAEESEESGDGIISSDLEDKQLSKTQKVKKNPHTQSGQKASLETILKDTQTPVASEESDVEEERLKEESGLAMYTQHS